MADEVQKRLIVLHRRGAVMPAALSRVHISRVLLATDDEQGLRAVLESLAERIVKDGIMLKLVIAVLDRDDAKCGFAAARQFLELEGGTAVVVHIATDGAWRRLDL